MLPGYNHNIRHKDRLFHVQTEDNGRDTARVVTQVFWDGQLIGIAKSEYKHILLSFPEETTRDEKIRAFMQSQHKQLLKDLVQGRFDDRIAQLPETHSEKTPTHIKKNDIQEASELPELSELLDFSEALSEHETEQDPMRDQFGSEALNPSDFRIIWEDAAPDPAVINTANLTEIALTPPPNTLTAAHTNNPKSKDPGGALDEHLFKRQPSGLRESAAPPVRQSSQVKMPEARRLENIPSSDTLIDFELPAALRQELKRAAEQAELERKRRTEQETNNTKFDPRTTSVRESKPVDTRGLRSFFKGSVPKKEPPNKPNSSSKGAEEKKKTNASEEPSLDEVILSYLNDERE